MIDPNLARGKHGRKGPRPRCSLSLLRHRSRLACVTHSTRHGLRRRSKTRRAPCSRRRAATEEGVIQTIPPFHLAAAVNAVSISAERMFAKLDRRIDYESARRIAMQAGLIPITNTLLAVGLVSLPGFMTGQILSGVSPLVAVRYHVMVMCMVFGASGLSAAFFLVLLRPEQAVETGKAA